MPVSPSDFNPHSREGSDPKEGGVVGWFTDFNPHSREGSDASPNIIDTSAASISIHTPARGVTCAMTDRMWSLLYFNPHSREGSDSHHPGN